MSSSNLSNFLSEYELNTSVINHRPRGLYATKTNTYINAIVQALLHIPQFYNLMNDLREVLDETNQNLPIVRAFTKLANYDEDITEDERFLGADYYLLPKSAAMYLSGNFVESEGVSRKFFNEDPMKYLVYLINAMNREMTSACEESNFVSPIKEIFRGTIEIKSNNHEVVDDSFIALPLDISGDHITTLSEALNEYFKADKPKESLNILPEVLILSVNLIGKDETGGLQKLVKTIYTSNELEIPDAILSEEANNTYTSLQKNYQLSSIIYHQGEDPHNPHHTVVVDHDNLGFLFFDGRTIVDLQKVDPSMLSPPDVNPYILTFRGKDLSLIHI